MLFGAKCKVQNSAVRIENGVEVLYYKNFDLPNFQPMDLIHKPESLPYIKVFKDPAIKKIEVYRTNAKVPDKIYSPISLNSSIAYSSTTKALRCTTVDTLIALKGRLLEFRACYSNISNRINEQNIFIYTSISPDSMEIDWIHSYNLYSSPEIYQKVDTIVNLNQIDSTLQYTGKYIMYRTIHNTMKIKCISLNYPLCLSGEEDRRIYSYWGCLFWSLFYHHKWDDK